MRNYEGLPVEESQRDWGLSGGRLVLTIQALNHLYALRLVKSKFSQRLSFPRLRCKRTGF